MGQVEGHSQRVTVRLQPSQTTVSVRFKELGERWEGTEGERLGSPYTQSISHVVFVCVCACVCACVVLLKRGSKSHLTE